MTHLRGTQVLAGSDPWTGLGVAGGPSGKVALAPGVVLAGKYRIEEVLGRGGMGAVVAATHLQLQNRVAIKFLLPEMLTSSQLVERFAQEARAAAQIRSEHVARVLDVGTLETGAPFMVMEYLDGRDLAARIEEAGALPQEAAVDFVLQASEAIAEAHHLGIIHRDLKSANLFCVARPDGEEIVKVLDFGISKTRGAVDMGLTGVTAMLGSPYYMSPEQMESARDVDVRTDVWSLGVILYELLSGALPFQAQTLPQQILLVTGRTEPDWDRLRDVPPGLVDVVKRCLRRPLDERYASVVELARDLAFFGSHRAMESAERVERISSTVVAPSVRPPLSVTEGRGSRPPRARVSRPDTLAALGQTADQALVRALQRRTGLVWLGSGAAALALLALVLFALRPSEPEAVVGQPAAVIPKAPTVPPPVAAPAGQAAPVIPSEAERARAPSAEGKAKSSRPKLSGSTLGEPPRGAPSSGASENGAKKEGTQPVRARPGTTTPVLPARLRELGGRI